MRTRRPGGTVAALLRLALASLPLMATGIGCGGSEPATTEGTPPSPAVPGLAIELTERELHDVLELSPLPVPPPLGPTNRYGDDARAARLGQYLFFEEGLSANGRIACATCHDPRHGWSDGKPRAEGLGPVDRNTQSLWNVAYNRWFFWDGRADSLWAQILHPLEHPMEMGMTRTALVRWIVGHDDVRAAYQAVFGPLPELGSVVDGLDARPVPDEPSHPHHVAWSRLDEDDQRAIDSVVANAGKAVAAFERRIVSTDAPFDRFVEGLRTGDRTKIAALSPAAQRGLELFVGDGRCTLCHLGPNFTDREFHNIGLDGGGLDRPDPGRFAGIDLVKSDPLGGEGVHSDDRTLPTNAPLHYVAKKPNNLGEFKTPSLRNVAQTAPYMHDGRFATLEEVLRFYSELDQEPALGHREESLRPLHLDGGQIADLVAFLESLTGAPLPDELLRQPASPRLDG